ncbi:MAG: YhcB family protein [Pseudomonadota bacterium]
MESMLAVGIAALVIGLALGWGIARSTGGRNVRQRRLAQQLDALQNEHTRYQAQVNEHFIETAELFRRLNASYRDVHEHLAKGASRLCTEADAREELEQVQRDHQLAHKGASEDSDLEPPRDYAPRHTRDDNGMLSEDYGLNREQSESPSRAQS